MLALLVVPACTDGGDDANWEPDARCAAVCDAVTCTDATMRQDCIDTCSIGIHATSTTCSACMLDNVCASGCTLAFMSATDCNAECADQPVVVPGDPDPRCEDICSADNACTTDPQVASCDAACDTVVKGVSGPCGSCLLDNICATGCDFRQTDASECNMLCD